MKNVTPAICLSIIFCLFGCGTKILHDDCLPARNSNFSAYNIEDVFMALPQHFFEMTIADRAHALKSHRTRICHDRKHLEFGGDGAQATISLTILQWHHPLYLVEVNSEFMGTNWTSLMRRVAGGWEEISEEKSEELLEVHKPLHPTAASSLDSPSPHH